MNTIPPCPDTMLVKIFYEQDEQTYQELRTLAQKIFPELKEQHVQLRFSRHQKYAVLALNLSSKKNKKLQQFYQQVHNHPKVKMVL